MATTSSLGAVVQSRGLAGCLTRTAWATVVRSHSRSWTAVRKPEQLIGGAQLRCPAAHAQGPHEHGLLRACLKRPWSARRLRPLMNNQYCRHSTVPASSLLDVPGRDVHPVGARRPGQRPVDPARVVSFTMDTVCTISVGSVRCPARQLISTTTPMGLGR